MSRTYNLLKSVLHFKFHTIFTCCLLTICCSFAFPKSNHLNFEKKSLQTNSIKTDEYNNNLPFTKKKKHLALFAEQLKIYQKMEGTKAYLIIYPANKAKQKETLLTGKRAKDYLVNRYGFKSAEITLIVGNYTEQSKTELWIQPNGWKSPPYVK